MLALDPGDPLADVVFALTFLAFQNSLEQFLGQVKATIHVPRRCGCIFGTREVVQETVPCSTCMDDLTILMEADSFESLLVKLAMEGTSRIASDFGFQLNLAPGKTEAVVSWVGPGSRPIRRRLMAHPNNRQVAMLPLNTRLDDDGDVQFPALAENDREMRIGAVPIAILGRLSRLGLAWDQRSHHVPTLDRRRRHALARRFLGNEGLPRHVRVQVAKACVASRCLHQAGTWDELQDHQLQRFEGGSEQTVAHHCWGPSAAAPRTELEVQ